MLPLIMLSLKPLYFEAVCAGTKRTEFRRGVFLKSPFSAFIYNSSPKMAVEAFATFGNPHYGSVPEIAALYEAQGFGVAANILNWATTGSTMCAIPILSVTRFAPISLADLRAADPTFFPPQRFVYLENKPTLLSYLRLKTGLPQDAPSDLLL